MLPKFLLDQQWGDNRANDSSQNSDGALQNITIPTLELLACCIRECLTTSIRERTDLENILLSCIGQAPLQKRLLGDICQQSHE